MKLAALIACPLLLGAVVWLIFYASKAKQPRNQFREHAERRQGSYNGEES